jgi:Catalytic LigB subunit of aromatic ring-opening dioxygenase
VPTINSVQAGQAGERDWTGLLRAGGHLHAMLKLAATVGEDLWSIGACNAGCDRDVLIAATPRRGPRDLPDLEGDTRWGLHLTNELVGREFDLTVSQDLAIDHGIFSWLPYVFRRPGDGWPVTVTPIAVNMIRQPLPTANRLRSLGRAIRASVEAFNGNDRVLVIATGGMSHQLSGSRFGIANEDLDRYFLRNLPGHLDDLVSVPVREYMRLGGTEAAELTLWFTMRAALSQQAAAVYTFQAVPAITGCGALVMAEPGALPDMDSGTDHATPTEAGS